MIDMSLPPARRLVTTAWRHWWVRALLAGVAGIAVLATLRGRLPGPSEILAAFRDTDPRWFAVAILLQVGSQVAFGWQQRVMLSAFGITMPRWVATAVAYSRSAISLAFPAGSAVSAGYAMTRYRRLGATSAGAATAMLLSAVASTGGLLLTYAGVAGSAIVVVSVLAAGAVAVPVLHAYPWPAFAWRARTGKIAETARRLLGEIRTVRPNHWVTTIALAVVNWVLDLACLVAAARGSGLSLSMAQLATVYLAVQVVRQIPVTPGGFGVIEASLLAGLVTVGAPHAAAAAAVLVYRLASCWLVLPAGLAAHFLLRHADNPQTPRPDADINGHDQGPGGEHPHPALPR